MSFAEFGASTSAQKKRQQQAQQQQQQHQARFNKSPSSGNSNHSGSTFGIDTISESLLQYQVRVFQR
jgi:hypothetical protein